MNMSEMAKPIMVIALYNLFFHKWIRNDFRCVVIMAFELQFKG
jgi:hypothetical protein